MSSNVYFSMTCWEETILQTVFGLSNILIQQAVEHSEFGTTNPINEPCNIPTVELPNATICEIFRLWNIPSQQSVECFESALSNLIPIFLHLSPVYGVIKCSEFGWYASSATIKCQPDDVSVNTNVWRSCHANESVVATGEFADISQKRRWWLSRAPSVLNPLDVCYQSKLEKL